VEAQGAEEEPLVDRAAVEKGRVLVESEHVFQRVGLPLEPASGETSFPSGEASFPSGGDLFPRPLSAWNLSSGVWPGKASYPCVTPCLQPAEEPRNSASGHHLQASHRGRQGPLHGLYTPERAPRQSQTFDRKADAIRWAKQDETAVQTRRYLNQLDADLNNGLPSDMVFASAASFKTTRKGEALEVMVLLSLVYSARKRRNGPWRT
jgi:hypothetical protein